MFCCFLSPRTSDDDTQNDEKKSLLTKGTPTIINYRTILSSPYAHVIRDDKIPIESEHLVETTTTDAYLLFNGTISDQAYDTACFSFDDANVSTPVVFATTTTNGHFLFERLFQLNHVTAINPSNAIQMQQIYQKKPLGSSVVPMAQPFDEYLANPTVSTDSLDAQGNSLIPKSN